MSFPEYPGAENYTELWGEASDRQGTRIDTIIVHCAVGSFPGYMEYLQRTRNVSVHYGIGRDGRIGQGVSEKWAAWAAGSQHWNRRSISIEHDDGGDCERKPWMTEAMFDASTKLAAYLCKKYDIGSERIIPHRDVATDGRSCPGPFFDLISYRDQISRLLSPSKPPNGPSLYRCIAGTFKARSGANRRVSELRGKGFEAALVFENGYFRVLAGSFRERAGADQRVKALKAKGIEAYVLPTIVGGDSGKVSKVEKGLRKALEFRGIKYGYWTWQRNFVLWADAIPSLARAREIGGVCSSVPNVYRLINGMKTPEPAGKLKGGTGAWFAAHAHHRLVDLNRSYPAGTLFMSDYRGEATHLQGHVAIAGESGVNPWLIQSDTGLGWNDQRRLKDTQQFAGFTHYALPEEWLS